MTMSTVTGASMFSSIERARSLERLEDVVAAARRVEVADERGSSGGRPRSG